MKPILCLDFDGVLHKYESGWQGARTILDSSVNGAMDWLVKLVNSNKFQVCIYSSRSKHIGGRWAMKQWIKKSFSQRAYYTGSECYSYVCQRAFADSWDLEVKDAAKRLVRQIKFPLFKPPAFLTIDDRCWCFTGMFPSEDKLLNFKPWYKKGE